jgi:hypothetical protein
LNIALPALVVFLVLLPGFVARSQIKRVERQLLDYSPFGVVVTEALLWAGALHLIWLSVTALAFDRNLAGEHLIGLISSNQQLQAEAIRHFGAQTGEIAWYFGTQFVAAYGLPKVIRLLITKHRLDRFDAPFSSLFRFNRAPWYYLLSGADFSEENVPDLIAISAVVDVAGEPTLFLGYLDDYFIDAEGKLDRLVLEVVQRRPIAADKGNGADDSQRFYAIDGDSFVLRYDQVITLNVRYVKLSDASPGTATETAEA